MLVPYFGKNIHKEEGITKLHTRINSEVELVKYLLDNMNDKTSLYFCFNEEICADIDTMVNIYRLFDQYGYTPQSKGLEL
jgi:hypothetical protein